MNCIITITSFLKRAPPLLWNSLRCSWEIRHILTYQVRHHSLHLIKVLFYDFKFSPLCSPPCHPFCFFSEAASYIPFSSPVLFSSRRKVRKHIYASPVNFLCLTISLHCFPEFYNNSLYFINLLSKYQAIYAIESICPLVICLISFHTRSNLKCLSYFQKTYGMNT